MKSAELLSATEVSLQRIESSLILKLQHDRKSFIQKAFSLIDGGNVRKIPILLCSKVAKGRLQSYILVNKCRKNI